MKNIKEKSKIERVLNGELKIKYRGFFDNQGKIQYPIIVYTPYKR